jgi:hypothetical protein
VRPGGNDYWRVVRVESVDGEDVVHLIVASGSGPRTRAAI